MPKLSKIEISTTLLIDILRSMVESVPGVDDKELIDIKVVTENGTSVIKIKCKAQKEFVNLFELALSIQEVVYFKLTKDLDGGDIAVNVEID